MNTWIGTSGFQIRGMERKFLSGRSATAKMLPFSERFSTSEIQLHFPRIPAPKTMRIGKTLTPEEIPVRAQSAAKDHHWSKLKIARTPSNIFVKS